MVSPINIFALPVIHAPPFLKGNTPDVAAINKQSGQPPCSIFEGGFPIDQVDAASDRNQNLKAQLGHLPAPLLQAPVNMRAKVVNVRGVEARKAETLTAILNIISVDDTKVAGGKCI
jgi:hypothetical protein